MALTKERLPQAPNESELYISQHLHLLRILNIFFREVKQLSMNITKKNASEYYWKNKPNILRIKFPIFLI